MKPRRIFSAACLSFPFASALVALFAAQSLHAATLTWNNGAATGNWNTTDLNWGIPQWNNATPDDAIFGATGVGTVTLTEAITAGSLTINTAGYTITGNTLTLSGGGTVLTSTATSAINSNVTMGVAGATITNSTGTLTLSGSVTGTGGITFRGTGNITVSGAIGSGTTSVGKTDGGTLTLSNAANAFTGQLQVSNGIVSVNSISNSGVASAIGTGSSIRIGQSGFSNTGTLRFTGASGGSTDRTIFIQSNNATSGGVIENTVSGQLLALTGTVDTTGLNAAGGLLTLTGAGNGLINGVMANGPGNLILTKAGAGTWTLSGANTYTGATSVTGGILKAGVASVANVSGAFGNNSAVTLSNTAGVALDITGFNTQIGSLTGGGTTGGNVTLGAATLTVGGNNTSPAAYAGAISGTGGVLTKIGTGTLTLSGANTLTGGLNVKAGTVVIGTALNVNALGAGTVTIGDSANTGAAATLTFAGAGAFPGFANPISVTGNGASTLRVTAHNPIFSSGVTLSNNLTIASDNSAGSQFTFNGGVTGTGNITVSINNTSNVSRVTFGTTAVNNIGTLTFNNAIVLGGTASSAATTGVNTISAAVGTNVTAITQGSNSNPLTVSGAITTGATNKVFNSTGTALFTLSGGTTGTGNVTFNANSTGNITVSTAAVNHTGLVTNSGTNSGTTTISSVIGTSVTGVTQNSATSQLTLSGANTYTGATTISAGALNIQNSTALGTTAGGVTVANGGALQIQGGIIVGAEAITINGGGVATPANLGAIRNISGTNTWGGTVTLGSQSRINSDAGTLTLSAANSVSATNLILVVGGAGNTTISGIVALGTGGIGKDGAGTLTLSGANTYTGAVTIATGGAITVNNNAALGTAAGGVTVSSGGALQLNAFTVGAEALTLNGTGISSGGALRGLTGTSSYGGAITLGSASRINTDAGTMTVSGAIGGAFGLTVGGAGNTTLSGNIAAAVTSLAKDGTGLLTLSGTNAYGGTSSVTGGTLAFTTTAAIPGYSTSPATAFGTFGSPRITAASGTTVSLPFGGANSISTTDIAGLLDGTTYNIFAAGSSLGIDTTQASGSLASTVITNAGSNAIGFTKTGANTLTLGSANTYSGPTRIVGGTLAASVIGNVGAASGSLGAPANAADGTISLGATTSTGTLSYTGAGETTDRVINLAGTTGGGGIDNSGSGTLVFSSPMTFTGAGAKTLTISGASNTTFGAAVAGGGVGSAAPLTIAKTGAGTLLLGAPGSTINTNSVTILTSTGGIVDIGTSGLTISNSGATVIQSSANATINATGGGVLTISSNTGANAGDIRPAAGTTLTINANINTPVTNTGFWTAQGGGLELNDAGTLVLTGNNSIAGVTSFTAAGTISVGNIAQNLGGTTGLLFTTAGSRFLYTGTGETTTVPLQPAVNSTVEQAGPSGTLNFSANWATGAAAKTVTLQGSTAGLGVMSGIISNNSATNTTAITKAGTGTWTLSGANTYTGATTVNGGNLVLNPTGSLSNTGITINSGGTVSPLAGFIVGNVATAAAGGRLTLNAGGTLNLADGTIGNLNLVQNATFAGIAATFAGGSIIFDISASAADMIDVKLNDAAGTGLATSSGMNGISFNPIAGSLGVGSYTLINAAGNLDNSNFFLASPNLVVGGTLYNLSLGLVGTNEVLTVATGGAAASPNVAYWKGTTDASWSLGSAGGVPTNWVTASTGTTDTFAVPGSTTNVILTADTVGTGGLSTTLDQAFTINSLNFTGTNTANTAGSTITSGTGSNTLTINAAALNGNAAGSGITVLAGSGANTISAPVALGASQTWTNNSTNALSVTGGISGTGFGLTVAGAGTVVLGSSNTFDGALSIGSGATGGTASISAGAGLGSNAILNLGGTTGAGTLIYTGTAATITQAVNLSGTTGGGVIDQSGTGHLNFTSNLTATGVGAKTLTLQGSTAGTGEISGAIINGSGTTAVTKTGTGTWILSGANTYTGTTTISAGTLQLGSATALGGAGALTMSGTGTMDLFGNSATVSAFTSVAGNTITNTSPSIAASTATAPGTPSGAGVYVDALTITTAGPTAAALITDGPTRKTQIVLSNALTNTLITTNTSNTFSGGLVLAHNATGTRLTIGTVSGTPWGTGPIIIGQTATDKAHIFVSTANQTLANPVISNTILGTDRVGTFRIDATGFVLSGQQTANLAPVAFSTNGTGAVSVTGKITGSQGLTLLSHTLGGTALTVTLNNTLNGSNDYQGDTVINQNPQVGRSYTLALGASNQIPNGANAGNVIINTNGTGVGRLNLGGFSETINGLSGNGTVDGISGTPTLTLGDNNATGLTFSGVIQNTAGTLSLTKTGTGTQTLSGANTFSGNTLVSAGTIALGNALALQNSAYDTASAAGGLDSTGFTTPTLGGLTGSGNLSPSLITAYGSITNLTLKPLTGVTNTHSGVIPDGAIGMALTKSGAGTQVLSGSNTYTGATSITAGSLNIQHEDALGGTGAGTTVANAASLQLQGGYSYAAEPLTLTPGGGGSAMLLNVSGLNTWNGTITSNTATSTNVSRIQSDAGTMTVAGLVTLSGSAHQLAMQGDGAITISGQITGVGRLTSSNTGTGIRTVSNDSNNFTGATNVNGGTFAFTSIGNVGATSSALGAPVLADATIQLAAATNAGTLRYVGTSPGGHTSDRVINLASTTGGATIEANGVGPLVLTATNTATGAGSKTLTLGGTNTGDNSIGAIVNNSVTNTTSLTKVGAGKWILSGANTYTGVTNVNEGILRVNGSHAGGGAYTVASAGTLQGIGSTASALNVSGILSPGASIETFASGTLNMLANSTFDYEVDSSAALGLSADLQIVTGGFNLTGLVNLSIGDAAVTDTAFANGTTFSLINYTGAWNNNLFTVGGNAIANAGTFTVGLNTWQLDYNSPTGGSNFTGEYAGGSDSFVNITVIPEPSSVALLGVLGSMLLLRRRR